MANITNTFNVSLSERVSAFARTIAKRFADYRLYQRSLSELNALSDRDLADLGLHRSMIRAVAFETVYGQ